MHSLQVLVSAKRRELTMNWNTVIGSKGRCKVKVRNWTSNNGDKMQSNEIVKFYEPGKQVQHQEGWKAGVF